MENVLQESADGVLDFKPADGSLNGSASTDEFCRRLLAQRFSVPIYKDIRTICDESPPPVDALIGSPPCQPFSTAGAKGGVGDERHLYPYFLKLVRKIQPVYILMEQVPNIFSFRGAFDEYAGGLAALGYDCVWHRIPACAVGAPDQTTQTHPCCGLHARTTEKPFTWRRKNQHSNELLPTVNYTGFTSSLIEAIEERLGEPAIFSRSNGIPHKLALGGYGNAIVPQIAQIIGQAINQTESEMM